MNKLNNKIRGIIVLSILILVGALLYYFFIVKENGEVYDNDLERNVLIPYENINNVEEENIIVEKIVIDISGEINNPGVFELEEGDRIKDAIESAGGLTKNADTTNMNLAYKLEDGMKIKVPSKNKNNTNQNTEEYISKDAKIGENTENDTNQNKIKKVNINKATKEQLQTLPGIGESTADKIIKYRQEKGKFKKKEDIKNVSRNRRFKI